jgi:hypothetical protein
VSVSGKFLTCKIGTAVIVGNFGWTVREKFERLDAITAADAGANRRDFGVGEAAITLRLLIDCTTGKYEPIVAGTEITTLKLYRQSTDTSPAYTFPIARVFRFFAGRRDPRPLRSHRRSRERGHLHPRRAGELMTCDA